MLSVVIALSAGILVGCGVGAVTPGSGWGITAGLLAGVGVMFLLARVFGKRLAAIVNAVQKRIEEAEAEAQRMVARFQTKPGASQQFMQSQIDKVVDKGIHDALDLLAAAPALYRWSPLAERQVNTLKMQLNYRIKRFEDAHALSHKVLVLEPMALAIKMALQYKFDSPELAKTFKKGVKRFKYEKAILIYALYSWILVKRKDFEQAMAVLAEAKEKTDDEVLQRNWECLANDRVKQFTNAGLGEQWFALQLEPMPKQKMRKGQMKGHPMMPRGKRRHF